MRRRSEWRGPVLPGADLLGHLGGRGPGAAASASPFLGETRQTEYADKRSIFLVNHRRVPAYHIPGGAARTRRKAKGPARRESITPCAPARTRVPVWVGDPGRRCFAPEVGED